jgi:hypothetical protein
MASSLLFLDRIDERATLAAAIESRTVALSVFSKWFHEAAS